MSALRAMLIQPKSAVLSLALASALFAAGELRAQQPPAQPPAQPADRGQASSEVMLSDAERQACVDAYSKGQTHKMLGNLRAARNSVQLCTITKCGRLAPECASMERELVAAIPTLLVRVRDHEGNDVADAQVIIGGRVIDFSAGLAVEMNPGNYLLVVQRPGAEPINQSFVLVAREKNRLLEATFPAPPHEPSPSSATKPASEPTPGFDVPDSGPDTTAQPGGLSPLVPIGFSVAGAGLVVFAIAGGISLDRQSELDDTCPDDQCPADAGDDVDAAILSSRVATAGVIALGLGAGLGVIGLLISDFSSKDPAKDAGAEPNASLELTPLLGPGFVGLSGRF
jgi:hypothetical protein